MRGSSSLAPSGMRRARLLSRSKGDGTGAFMPGSSSGDLLDEAALVPARVLAEAHFVHEAAHEQQAQAALAGMGHVLLRIRQHDLVLAHALARVEDVDLEGQRREL